MISLTKQEKHFPSFGITHLHELCPLEANVQSHIFHLIQPIESKCDTTFEISRTAEIARDINPFSISRGHEIS